MASGGFGQESYGDPMGGGGPLQVLAARAVTSQLVRVAFTVEPVHVTPAGRGDALNPSNYVFSVDAGAATDPQPTGVLPTLVPGPALGVPSGAWGVDVGADRALVTGITYRVMAHGILAKTGGTLGSPYSAPFPGVAKLVVKNPPPRKVEMTDVANDPFGGAFRVDDSGDLGIDTGVPSLRKRMLRRASTPVNSFAHLPGYGTKLRLKKPFSPAMIAELRTDLRTQIMQEPEVADAAVTVTQTGVNNVIQVLMRAKTKAGAVIDVSAQVLPGGIVVP